VFATILAMITDEVNNVLLAARSGRTGLVLSGHVLLLNWNSTVRAPHCPWTGIQHVGVCTMPCISLGQAVCLLQRLI
jgi:hypothetical protein